MLLPSEFLSYYSRKTTRQTYKTALQRYLALTLGKTVTDHTLDLLWTTYLAESETITADLIAFPEKCRIRTPSFAPKTINLYTQIVLMYLRECGIEPDHHQQRRLKKTRPKNRPISRETELTRDTIQTILHHADVRQRAEILIAVSSGMRISELLSITLDDLTLTADPVEIYIPAAISKNETARTVFISREAADALRAWLITRRHIQKHTKDGTSPDKRVFPYSVTNETARFNRTLRRAGTYRIDTKTRRSMIHFHIFRKFFLTEFKLAASPDVAEELAGHTGYLSEAYRRISRQTMREEYHKAEPQLTIETGNSKKECPFPVGDRYPEDMKTELHKIQSDILRLQELYQLIRTQLHLTIPQDMVQ